MIMSLSHQIIIIGMVVLGTVLTRFVPFLLFPAGRETPECVQYLGRVLPSAALGMLVVYCYRDVDVFGDGHGIPELLASAVVVGLHCWRRSMILSIAGGTVVYMAIIHTF